MPFKKGHKVEPHWHRPVGAENGLSTEAVSRTRRSRRCWPVDMARGYLRKPPFAEPLGSA